MLKRVRGIFKNQKGLTLVELLAVIVILGIIAAIAVPSIGGIIKNSKTDAHIANAQQMVSAARMASAGGLPTENVNGTNVGYHLDDLIAKGYLEPLNDPDGGTSGSAPYIEAKSYVQIMTAKTTGNFTYLVFLDGNKRNVGEADSPVLITGISRDNVEDNPPPPPTSPTPPAGG
ncbi:type II secretion system protein [Peribacillus saganii]|uniref:Type II secretion system protein n=1 Tax=Peribacillus saganii TaxID=2303992 RepID=A0A372LVH9_9BACI|nr:type II secretion system protein [Peribacillus saganii]RFU71574.1 type II secretion system protein [Peribacillus saganii]